MNADRDETAAERYDRNWLDLIQELRVAQTGIQVLAGFLLTVPFSYRFKDIARRRTGCCSWWRSAWPCSRSA